MRISDWSSDVCSSDLDPQQVLRVLIFQGPPRFDPGVNEEVVARFVDQLPFPQEGEVRGRDRCAQPLAGTVGGMRGLSMALHARKCVVRGKSVSVRVDLGGRRSTQNKTPRSSENE